MKTYSARVHRVPFERVTGNGESPLTHRTELRTRR
jgi:hypothetical protein